MKVLANLILVLTLLSIGCGDTYLGIQDNPGKRLFEKLLTQGKFEGLADSVYTGYFDVYEDRKIKKKKIQVFVMVMPSYNNEKVFSPIFHLEGGPGSGATTAASYYEVFTEFRKNRDVVIIDFRGTGKSSGLFCSSLLFNADNPQEAFDDMFPVEKVKDCYKELSDRVDLRQYSTTNAIDDIEEIRNWLGYDKINLISFSYGTRACQSYLRQYPQSIRSAIMFGPAPSFSHRPEPFARDAQETWELLCRDCKADSVCSKTYPNLRDEFDEILKRLSNQPAYYQYVNPSTSVTTTIAIRKAMFSEIIRTIMYSCEGQRMLPSIIHQVYQGNFEQIVKRALRRSETYNEISDAFYLCVTCSEDVPYIDTARIILNTENTFLGDYRIKQELRACEHWPRYELDEDYLVPVQSDTPVLILTGDRDPVTPPRWGIAMAQKMSNHRHIVVPYLSHIEAGLSNLSCLSQSFSEFFDAPSSQFDIKCLDQMKPRPFY